MQMAAAKTMSRTRVSRANRTIIRSEDDFRMRLDMLGPFAPVEDLEHLLASAPPGSEDANYVRGYIANQRMGVPSMSSDDLGNDD
jgi:hypothetical protein